jgi:hypothetical protein
MFLVVARNRIFITISSKTDTVETLTNNLYKATKYENVNLFRKYISDTQTHAILFTLPDGAYTEAGFYSFMVNLGQDLIICNTCPNNTTYGQGFITTNVNFMNLNTKSKIIYTISHRKVTSTQYQILISWDSLTAGEIYIMPLRYHEQYNNNMITIYNE